MVVGVEWTVVLHFRGTLVVVNLATTWRTLVRNTEYRIREGIFH